jgi:hypothetical protein
VKGLRQYYERRLWIILLERDPSLKLEELLPRFESAVEILMFLSGYALDAALSATAARHVRRRRERRFTCDLTISPNAER